jgi:hypothetical protein
MENLHSAALRPALPNAVYGILKLGQFRPWEEHAIMCRVADVAIVGVLADPTQ